MENGELPPGRINSVSSCGVIPRPCVAANTALMAGTRPTPKLRLAAVVFRFMIVIVLQKVSAGIRVAMLLVMGGLPLVSLACACFARSSPLSAREADPAAAFSPVNVNHQILDLHSANSFFPCPDHESYFFVSIPIRRLTFGVYWRVGSVDRAELRRA